MMATNRLSRAQRQALGRQLAQQNKERIAAGELGADFYARAGRKGFRVTLQKHGSRKVAQLLSAFYNRVIDPRSLERNREREREHQRTRAAYPLAGALCARCGAPAEHRDHVAGWQAGHGAENIALLCAPCHKAVSLERVKEEP